MQTFSHLGSTYRTDVEAKKVERRNPISGEWHQTHSLDVREEALRVTKSARDRAALLRAEQARKNAPSEAQLISKIVKREPSFKRAIRKPSNAITLVLDHK